MTNPLHRIEEMPAGEPPFFRATRLRARRRVLWMRSLWADAHGTQGLAIPDAEVDRILADPDGSAAAEQVFYRSDPAARQLTLQIEATEQDRSRDSRWIQVVGDFGLEPAEADLLALALLVEADPWWRRVCAYLHDDAAAGFATPWLARTLSGWQEPAQFGPSSAIVRWHMARPVAGTSEPWNAAAPWCADPGLLGWLLRSEATDPLLGDAARTAPPACRRCLYDDELAFMTDLCRRVHRDGTGAEIEIIGPDGAGKETLAGQLCERLGWTLLAVDAAAPTNVTEEHLTRAVRLARLSNSAVYWRSADRVDPRLWRHIRGEAPLQLYGASSPVALSPHHGAAHVVVTLPKLSQRARIEIWTSITRQTPSEKILQLPLLPGEISTAALAVPGGPRAVEAACSALLAGAPGELFVVLPQPYDWNDIVLPPQLRSHIEEIEAHARLRTAVLEDWGFERLTPMGRGLTALFAGPSGTGKTMAVQVIGKSLGLEVRRVDLSSVVNKYVGETEKRLKQVFDACERTSAILLFDEADALFGQRTQVKDAHDRFANIEINYLLQRMEQFDGIAVLATNRKEDLDRGFLRRLRFVVDFLPPGPRERLDLWRKSLIERTPEGLELLDPSVNLQALADRLDMTGASIKNAALRAAFLARAEGSTIAMRHIVAAVRREMQKHGHVVRQGDLEGLV